MTGGAVHLAFFNGHVGIPFDLGHNVLMALRADLLNLGFYQQEFVVLRGMHAMAGQAGNVPFLMLAADPVRPVFIGVTLQAGLCEVDGRHSLELLDRGKARVGLIAGGGRMERSGAMTRFAGFLKRDSLELSESAVMDG